ncbi:interleukin-20-like [Amblyraja radiata]|uniref:interleukin-20-like n=1 Tax=Amblyraja radiata TaxID=386614 RepID=UPI00140368B2|nr:interleukin-20-like [Amblyraja radiata]
MVECGASHPVCCPVQTQESCCFLRHMLRFYVETVFRHHTPSSPLMERRTSCLANCFLSIKILLRQCLFFAMQHDEMRCHCAEETREKIKLIQDAFEKVGDWCLRPVLTNDPVPFQMDLNAAAVKAIGEINILIDWMQQA